MDEDKHLRSMFEAIDSGNFTQVEQILNENAMIINRKSVAGQTPLHRASLRLGDNVELVKILLVHGANPESLDNDGMTPFDCAEFIVNVDIAHLLETLRNDIE